MCRYDVCLTLLWEEFKRSSVGEGDAARFFLSLNGTKVVGESQLS